VQTKNFGIETMQIDGYREVEARKECLCEEGEEDRLAR